MLTSDTIAAIVTPQGRGGVGIIRVSGPECLAIAGKIISNLKTGLKPQEIHLGMIEGLDKVIYYFFKSPNSCTGENLIEISCHGSMAVLGAALKRAIAAGARQAKPGEFSFRAFLNGKIDLTQAEAILELVNAKTEKAAKLAYEELAGTTSNRIKETRASLLALLTEVEGAIDFPEDMVAPRTSLDSALRATLDALDEILRGANKGIVFREGYRVAIIGKPNVGKSTLFNRLLKWERTIVSSCPGTTRDTIAEHLELEGIPIKIIDTAGIEEGREGPEGEGIERAKREAEIADLILMVLDGSSKETMEDLRGLERIDKNKAIIILNKVDLGRESGARGIAISALKGDGLEELENAIINKVVSSDGDGQVLISQRQQECLIRAKEALQRARNSVKIGAGEELVAIDLRGAIEALDQSLGNGIGEEVVNAIFANFCVGK